MKNQNFENGLGIPPCPLSFEYGSKVTRPILGAHYFLPAKLVFWVTG